MLAVEGISAAYQTPHGLLQAVDDASLQIDAGDTLALVGESGCGKSTLGRTVLQLQPATRGSVRFNGVDLTKLTPRQLVPYRPKMQMVFQDPSASLNPRQRIATILETPLKVHGVRGRKNRRDQVAAVTERVGLPRDSLDRYPHEFSGGQKQRIGIARALILKPALMVCDEPVSALDVSVQAQILNLLVSLKKDLNLSYLFISHDLGVVRYMADRIAVMYLGRIVESAPHRGLWTQPLHPYTRGLIQAVPGQGTPGRPNRVAPVPGDLPNPLAPPTGCRYHPRCPLASDHCRARQPELRQVQPGHWVACHFAS